MGKLEVNFWRSIFSHFDPIFELIFAYLQDPLLTNELKFLPIAIARTHQYCLSSLIIRSIAWMLEATPK
uniref:Uncharacterized protein n=1 Tax=Desertifilum tharense IPPAS B-1220 TaxID=1781255 RepID=A0A1E5QG34_9CYAN|nr:hypothetical protein BH720_19185 [Desertifilum tharense IPPAS B-1220]